MNDLGYETVVNDLAKGTGGARTGTGNWELFSKTELLVSLLLPVLLVVFK